MEIILKEFLHTSAFFKSASISSFANFDEMEFLAAKIK